MHTQKIGPLRAHLAGGEDGQGGGSGPTIVLLHGFGAPGTDLVGLADVLDVPRATRFVFPEAPHVADVGLPAPYDGRAWWPIDMLKLQMALTAGRLDEMAESVPEGLKEARQCLATFLDALDSSFHLSAAPVVLGGFSQGAMLSTDLVLHSDREFAGLLILSGTLIAQERWRTRLSERAPLPFFQSHGVQDAILPHSLAIRLHQLLLDHAWPGELISFAGGHGIGPEALAGAGRWVSKLFR